MTTAPSPKRAAPDLFDLGPVALINMPDRRDRLRDTLQALRRHVCSETDVDDLVLIRPRRFDDPGGFMSVAYRSCLDAHLQAAELALDQGWPAITVLEDDVDFLPDWRRHGPALLATLDETPHDIAMLGYLDDQGEVAATGPDPATPTWQRFDGEVTGAHAYRVPAHHLPAWVEHLRAVAHGTPGDPLRGPMSPDGAINTATWVDPPAVRIIARPNLVVQRPSRSDVNTTAVDRVGVLRPVAAAVRRIRVAATTFRRLPA